MMYKLLLLIIFCLLLEKAFSQVIVDPEAVRLNRSALEKLKDKSRSAKANEADAIAILDQAIKIDSDFYTAYFNKCRFQERLNLYEDAIITAQQMVRLRPDNATIYITLGINYEKIDNPKTADQCFEKALAIYSIIVDNMNVNDRNYRKLKFDKARTLALLQRRKMSNDILTELYDTEKDENMRKIYTLLTNTSWRQLVFGPTERF